MNEGVHLSRRVEVIGAHHRIELPSQEELDVDAARQTVAHGIKNPPQRPPGDLDDEPPADLHVHRQPTHAEGRVANEVEQADREDPIEPSPERQRLDVGDVRLLDVGSYEVDHSWREIHGTHSEPLRGETPRVSPRAAPDLEHALSGARLHEVRERRVVTPGEPPAQAASLQRIVPPRYSVEDSDDPRGLLRGLPRDSGQS